ncbi:MAG: alpha-amylase family glycosyl hydrolase, partial [Deltaproteobacteria bacterium]|nr:alpha-amylase family glycosyl hydrolase [Deltaproteobacteria bacterium]
MLNKWPAHPVIYEINTWVWLGELSRRYQTPITLANVPEAEWEALTACSPDAVWLMGVWERSVRGREIALTNESFLTSCCAALPDFTPDDLMGSPYCVRGYRVDEHLGGPEGLARAREQLAKRGARLILDLVPNHVAPDHPWVQEHPDYFIQGTPEDLRLSPEAFLPVGGHILASGRDPYFPPWPDVIQVNAFAPGLRQAFSDTLLSLAGQCDGVRCDMAMLLINQIFRQTWGERTGALPAREFWEELIPAVKAKSPEFLMIAEAYWDLEWELLQQGFDYCYDKRLYDRLRHGSADAVRQHLLADLGYQERLVRFIENHDEPRAAAAFDDRQARAAAVTIATLPGASLFHEGQFEGRRVRLPVFLNRRPPEPVDSDLQKFYQTLLAAVAQPVFKEGDWRLGARSGWPDNRSYLNLAAWGWRLGEERRLIIVNLAEARSQALVPLPWNDLPDRTWQL